MKYRSLRTNETYEEYQKMRSECHELLRRTKHEYWESLQKEWNPSFWTTEADLETHKAAEK
jgi:hypothetical protein